MIKDLRIYFDPNDLRRYLRALTKVLAAVQRESREMPYRMAVDYVDLLRGNIMTQKFAGSYAPYNTRYAGWKAQYFATTGFLVMRGAMLNSLKVFRDRGYKNRWYGGLPPDAGSVPGSSWFGPPGMGKSKSINMYAYLNEFGGIKSPKRPVFVPTKKEYERDGFLKRVNTSKNVIGRAWR